MPTFLTILGLIISVGGLVLIGAGAPDWMLGLSLGNAMIESGMIAFVGGLILSGIGMVLRELRRLGERLAAAAAPVQELFAEEESSIVPTEIPVALSHRLRPSSRNEPAPEPIGHPSAGPTIEEEIEATQHRHWPPSTSSRTAVVAAPPRMPAAAMPEAVVAAQVKDEPEEATPSEAVVRSGIIGGMAYTLYADGSIEAELPAGTMRFASLEELREHIARAESEAKSRGAGQKQ